MLPLLGMIMLNTLGPCDCIFVHNQTNDRTLNYLIDQGCNPIPKKLAEITNCQYSLQNRRVVELQTGKIIAIINHAVIDPSLPDNFLKAATHFITVIDEECKQDRGPFELRPKQRIHRACKKATAISYMILHSVVYDLKTETEMLMIGQPFTILAFKLFKQSCLKKDPDACIGAVFAMDLASNLMGHKSNFTEPSTCTAEFNTWVARMACFARKLGNSALPPTFAHVWVLDCDTASYQQEARESGFD